MRIQNIVNELQGEKIDVIEWAPDQAGFVANALSPARVLNVTLNEEEKTARVLVPSDQMSLAIGKEGQNARLANRPRGAGQRPFSAPGWAGCVPCGAARRRGVRRAAERRVSHGAAIAAAAADAQISTSSKSSLRAPHSGHVQLIGTSSQRVPAAMPSSGMPAASS